MILYIDDKTDFLQKVKTCAEPNQVLFLQHSYKIDSSLLQANPSLIICDIHMPLVDGFEIYRMFREFSLNTYFIFLSEDDSHLTVSRTLNLYNCTFISRSISEGHLKAIIQANCSEFKLCEKQLTASYQGNDIPLTPIEFKILLALKNSNLHIAKEDLKKIVWDKVFVSDRTINTHIGNLRLKLKEHDLHLQIHRNGYVEFYL